MTYAKEIECTPSKLLPRRLFVRLNTHGQISADLYTAQRRMMAFQCPHPIATARIDVDRRPVHGTAARAALWIDGAAFDLTLGEATRLHAAFPALRYEEQT